MLITLFLVASLACQALGEVDFEAAPTKRTQHVVHLRRGDARPDSPPKAQRLFAQYFCPYCHRVHLVAAQLGIDLDTVNVNSVSKPAWYTPDVHPLGQVPALEMPSGRIFIGSVAISELIDKTSVGVASDERLVPEDPLEEARARTFFDVFEGRVKSQYYATFYRNSSIAAVKLLSGMAMLEERIDGPFVLGSKVSLIDFLVYPWIERFLALPWPLDDAERIPLSDKWQTWFAAMRETRGVRDAYLPAYQHRAYYNTIVSGNKGPKLYDLFVNEYSTLLA